LAITFSLKRGAGFVLTTRNRGANEPFRVSTRAGA
jgi:hypothetical protein